MYFIKLMHNSAIIYKAAVLLIKIKISIYQLSSLYVCMAIKHIIVLFVEHHVNLLLQSFRSVSPDLHQC